MARGLIFLDHAAEAVDGREILQPVLVPAPDLHILAGEMVAGEIDLEGGVAGIGRVREAVDHLLQGGQRLLRRLLVAAHILDLLVVAQRLQIIGVGGVLVAGMQIEEMVDGADGLVIAIAAVIGIGIHDLGLGRDGRVGMLRLDLFEEPGRIADVAGLQGGHALVVERLGRLIGDLIAPRQIGIRLASRQARPKEDRAQQAADQGQRRKSRQPSRPMVHSAHVSL